MRREGLRVENELLKERVEKERESREGVRVEKECE